jgi:hypothetical protein
LVYRVAPGPPQAPPTDNATNARYDLDGDGKITTADANSSGSRSGFTVNSFPEPIVPSP